MKAVGIIAEYNPFHNGHAYQLAKAKEITGADFAVVIMSGDFVQRGEPAIINKFTRTEMALLGGADLVLELPVRYATGSAEYFASGAIKLLDSLGIIDVLCFGSEYENTSDLITIAGILAEEPEEYQVFLRQNLSDGISYPLSMARALEIYAQNHSITLSHSVSELLSAPNCRLGIEYCRALIRLHSDIIPTAVRRIGSDYHQKELSETYSSASALRNCIHQGKWSLLDAQIPVPCKSIFINTLKKREFVTTNDYSLLLKYKLMQETAASLTSYLDVSPELANRVFHNLNNFSSFDTFVQLLKTKDVTYSRISRALLHVLLNIRAFHLQDSLQSTAPYARILGFRKSSSCILSAIKQHGTISLISKTADYASVLDDTSRISFEQDLWCSNLYETAAADKAGRAFVNEISKPIILI